jgi:hypothetical protein
VVRRKGRSGVKFASLQVNRGEVPGRKPSGASQQSEQEGRSESLGFCSSGTQRRPRPSPQLREDANL